MNMEKMSKEHIPVITDREELYDKCENMEQLFDKYYLPLLYKHYSETYKLQQENKKYKEVIDKLNNKINSLKTCEDKPKEDIIYPHWEICNETKQEMLDILKEVE